MVEIVDTHVVQQDLGAGRVTRPAARAARAVRSACGAGPVALRYRPVWDLGSRQVTALEALPVVELGPGAPMAPAAVWSIARSAGLHLELLRSMEAAAEVDQQMWCRSGLQAPVSIASITSPARGRATGRSGRGATVALDLGPLAASCLFGLASDRRWRVQLPAADAADAIGRCHGAGFAPDAVRLSAALVHRFTHDATRLRLIAGCVEIARRHGTVVLADGADDGESVRGLATLGCHLATGAGLGPDLTACEVSTLRWVGPSLRPASNRLLPAAG